VNWLTYIYAVAIHQVLQASLGYFITPLMNVLLGVLFLKERLRPYQVAGILLAAIGVVNLGLLSGQLPWIAMTLATTFAFYGLLRKTLAVDGLIALYVETLFLLVPSLACLGWYAVQGTSALVDDDGSILALLALGGVVTTVPLLLFAAAARRLRFATLGVLQYLAPTVQFLLAVTVFGEPFSTAQLVSFACIWSAVAIYTFDSLRSYRRERAELLVPPGSTPQSPEIA
jgi:chloramphenicol-sensitive protein RarD